MTDHYRASGHPARVIGVDVARGIALIGMMTVHVFDTFHRDGTPTLATVVAGGRSATTFVLVAGVSLAFLRAGGERSRGRPARQPLPASPCERC